jgi:hypothetical protein
MRRPVNRNGSRSARCLGYVISCLGVPKSTLLIVVVQVVSGRQQDEAMY